MRSVHRSAPKRALIWLFAVACLTALVATGPRAAGLATELRASAASIRPAPARDAGKALVRDAHGVRVAAPAPEPLPPVVPTHATLRLARPTRDVLDDVRIGARGIAARIVRWRSHIPRMDSGEPPRSEAFAS